MPAAWRFPHLGETRDQQQWPRQTLGPQTKHTLSSSPSPLPRLFATPFLLSGSCYISASLSTPTRGRTCYIYLLPPQTPRLQAPQATDSLTRYSLFSRHPFSPRGRVVSSGLKTAALFSASVHSFLTIAIVISTLHFFFFILHFLPFSWYFLLVFPFPFASFYCPVSDVSRPDQHFLPQTKKKKNAKMENRRNVKQPASIVHNIRRASPDVGP